MHTSHKSPDCLLDCQQLTKAAAIRRAAFSVANSRYGQDTCLLLTAQERHRAASDYVWRFPLWLPTGVDFSFLRFFSYRLSAVLGG